MLQDLSGDSASERILALLKLCEFFAFLNPCWPGSLFMYRVFLFIWRHLVKIIAHIVYFNMRRIIVNEWS